MVFPSLQFAFFFPVVLSVSWALMSRPRLWKPFVLAASYVFYSAASPGYSLLLAAVTLANQAAAVLIGRARSERARKLVVAGAVTLDLGALGVFKYYGFFAEEIFRSLDAIGLGMPLPLLARAPDRAQLHHVPGESRTWSTSSAGCCPPRRRSTSRSTSRSSRTPIARA